MVTNPFSLALYAAWVELSKPEARHWYGDKFKASAHWFMHFFTPQPACKEMSLFAPAPSTEAVIEIVSEDIHEVIAPDIEEDPEKDLETDLADKIEVPPQPPIAAPVPILCPAVIEAEASISDEALFTLEDLKPLKVKELRKLAREHALKIEDGTSISNARKKQLVEGLTNLQVA